VAISKFAGVHFKIAHHKFVGAHHNFDNFGAEHNFAHHNFVGA
jgi:hypothetical protein